MIAYRDISSMVDAGKTPSQIASILQSDQRTNRDIPIADARRLLITEWGLIRRVNGIETGPLADLYATLEGESKDMVGSLIAHLLDNPSANSITLTDPDYATAFFALLDHPALALTPDQLATLEALHGGQKYVDITEPDITNCITQHNLEARYSAALSAGRAAINDGATDWPTVRDAIVVAGDDWGA